jgi:hypothetical protein
MGIHDLETVEQITENPYGQYFIGAGKVPIAWVKKYWSK